MSDCENQMSVSEKKKEDWMNAKWRPMMGWMYMAVCCCDFMLFPILWSIHQAVDKGQVNLQWQPLTLQGAGLFHIAMGAVLGIAAYGRTKEKMAGAENGGLSQGFGPNAGTQYTPPGMQPGMMNNNMGGMNSGMGGGFGGQQSGGFGAPAGGGFGGTSSGGFGSSSSGASTFGAPAAGGFGSPPAFGATNTAPPAFGATNTAPPAFGSSSSTAPTLTTTPPPAFGGKPSGPTQSFPAL